MSASRRQTGEGRLLPLLWLVVLPLVVTILLVLLGSVLIGLPVTVLLRKRGGESAAAYIAAGAVGGLALPALVLLALNAPSGYWTCLLGAFSGGVTGATWWTRARKPNVR